MMHGNYKGVLIPMKPVHAFSYKVYSNRTTYNTEWIHAFKVQTFRPNWHALYTGSWIHRLFIHIKTHIVSSINGISHYVDKVM